MTDLVRTYVERNISGSWSDISTYVVGDIEYDYRIPSNRETDKLASVGRMKLVMDNEDGSFSPNANFHRGTPVRVRTVYDGTSKTRFLGTILEVDPDTLEWGDQYVRVTVVDWMNFAVDHPMIVPQLQSDMRVDEAVAYLLTQMDKQPESVTYHEGRETFDFVFDTIKKETKAYSELYKLAMSEFAPIYLRAGNVLVVESADTRHGMRELTRVPVGVSNSGYLLKEDGGFLLKEDGGKLILDQIFVPNFVSGSYTFTDLEVKNGDMLTNRMTVKAYPARYDESNVLLFQLDVGALNIPTLGWITIKGNWANPDGGGPINALTSSFPGLITGTNYAAFNELGGDISQNLWLVEVYGTEGFQHDIFNNGIAGFITKYNIYGKGIYPYNPVEALASITGSVANYGIAQLSIDQKYQDNIDAGRLIAESILDRDKEPRLDVKSLTFEASSSPELMQASQHIDTGDLVWVKNVKPSIDSYCYIQGKKVVLSPAGWVTEKWYLKEMDSLRKGLTPVALEQTSLSASKNGVNFGRSSKINNLQQKTLTGWIRNKGTPNTAPMFSKYDGDAGWMFFQVGTGKLWFTHEFSIVPGTWETDGIMTGSAGAWHHLALTYDSSSTGNDPTFYLDGVQISTITEVDTPAGTSRNDELGELVIGNTHYPSFDYFYNFNGYWKDCRIYNRILTPSEIALLAANENNYLVVTDGLVFQAPAVRTEDYGMLTGTVLYPQNKILDNMYGLVGTPNWNIPSGTAFAIKAIDPDF